MLIMAANVTVILSCGFAGHETRLQPAFISEGNGVTPWPWPGP